MHYLIQLFEALWTVYAWPTPWCLTNIWPFAAFGVERSEEMTKNNNYSEVEVEVVVDHQGNCCRSSNFLTVEQGKNSLGGVLTWMKVTEWLQFVVEVDGLQTGEESWYFGDCDDGSWWARLVTELMETDELVSEVYVVDGLVYKRWYKYM